MSEMSSDWWLEQDTLEAPKQEIGDYVESQGFAVPTRFNSLDDALRIVKAGGKIAIRSEHPEDYDGPSGLMKTYVLDSSAANDALSTFRDFGSFDIDEELYKSRSRGAVTPPGSDGPGYRTMEDVVLGVAMHEPTDITIQRLKQLASQETTVERYAELTGRNTASFMDKASYSFWEYINGTNVAVVADTAVDDRYHVLASSPKQKGRLSYRGWQIANERGVSVAGKADDTKLTSEMTARLVHVYEQIRNLPRFASEHCPIMEFQLDDDNQIWFLQYLRTRDFQAATDSLNPSDFSQAEGWKQINCVRGALPVPASMKTTLWYPRHYGTQQGIVSSLPQSEDASTDWHWDLALTEIMSRRRRCYVSTSNRENIYDVLTLTDPHLPRSRWFKPLAAIACNDRGLRNLIPEEIKKEVSRSTSREGRFMQIVLDVAIGENNGFVRLSPDFEQPVPADI